MLFKEYTYSVLIASSSEKFAQNLLPLLPENEFGPVETVKTTGEARRKLINQTFDIILVNTPLSDEFGTKFALDVSADTKSGILMFVKSDLYEEITDKVIDYGILTLSKPTSSMTVHQIFKNMYAMQERFRFRPLFLHILPQMCRLCTIREYILPLGHLQTDNNQSSALSFRLL